MPELPDVEIFRRRLERGVGRQRIIDAKVMDAHLLSGISAREFERHLVGRSVRETQRHGKYLIVKLDDGTAFVLHFGMTGTLETSSQGPSAPKYEVLHMALGKDRWASVTTRRKLGHMWVTADVAAFLAHQDQGPDALESGLNLNAFVTALGSKRSMLKAALMDQARIAGIGNIYSDEILFQAKLHPLARVGDLGHEKLASLHRTMRKVLRAAIARNVMAERPASAFPRGWLAGHRVKGGVCPRCAATLATLKIGSPHQLPLPSLPARAASSAVEGA